MDKRKSNGSMAAIVVDSDTLSRTTISGYLANQGVRVAAAVDRISSGLNLIRGMRPQILVIELPRNPEESLESIRRIRGDYPDLGIIASAHDGSSEMILRSLRAGAQEFLGRPLDVRELGEAINRLTGLQRGPRAAARHDGRIVLLSSGKGGVGVTSVATNLALSLCGRPDSRTVLVDCGLQRSDAGLMLDLPPSRTLASLIGNGPLDEEMLGTVLASHASGLSLLSAVESSDQAQDLTPLHLVETLGLLEQMFDYVVVDAGRLEDERMAAIAGLADAVMLVTLLDVLSVRNAVKSLAFLHQVDYPEASVLLLVNRFEKKSRVTLDDLRSATGLPVFWQIPNDYGTMSLSIDAGAPAVLRSPRSLLARSFADFASALARRLAEPAEQEMEPAKAEK